MREALLAFGVGLLMWGLPSVIDALMGGKWVATDAWLAWLLVFFAGSVLLHRVTYHGANCSLAALSAAFGSVICLVVLSMLHALVTDNPEELGGGFQNTSWVFDAAIGVFAWIGFSLLYLAPAGLGWVRRPRQHLG